ncbi:MAG: IS1380 family transposase [Thermodesulfobacteriota bacterium]|nr:IS1380 family transposase [Thermodesulfobacteriota bacterium]
MSTIKHKQLNKRKKKIQNRLEQAATMDSGAPVFTASNIHYELSQRVGGIGFGGIGAMMQLVNKIGLAKKIDDNLPILKCNRPYHESDHILNIAFNCLMGNRCLEDLELLRNDINYLDALGATKIPDPTTAGDFCRRFSTDSIMRFQEIINEARLVVWNQQREAFFEEAVIDADGVVVETTGECKKGMGLSYNGKWGYHTLVISLANTNEHLYLMNRPGNRPSHEGAAPLLNKSIDLCTRAGFKKVRLRGDTDFSQTTHLDGWDDRGVTFVFGIDAKKNLLNRAESLAEGSWEALDRKEKYEIKTSRRARPANVKKRIVQENGYKNLRLKSEHVAEFDYQPVACDRQYRMVVVRKNISVERGEDRLFDEIRYFFYISNDRYATKEKVVEHANKRCNQENLNAQLSNGIPAMKMPLDSLKSNWAYMVISGLAWTLKAWMALMMPVDGRWKTKHLAEKNKMLGMEFRTFINYFMRIPCQIINQGRKLIYRIIGWNTMQDKFIRFMNGILRPLRC